MRNLQESGIFLNIFNRTELWVIANQTLQVNMTAEVPLQYLPQNTQESFS